MRLDSTFRRFVAAGVLSVSVDFAVLILLISLGAHPLLANLLSFPSGIATNYALHRRWTFRSSAPVRAELLHFLVVSLTGVVIAQVIIWAWMTIGGYMIGKLLSIAVVFMWNYSMSRGWVFR